MKIKVLRNTRASGVSLVAGKVAEVSEADAAALIRLKKAAAVKAPAKKKALKKL